MEHRGTKYYLRKFVKSNECNTKCNPAVVGGALFTGKFEFISFHLRPKEWTEKDIDEYRRKLDAEFSVPGVLELGSEIFTKQGYKEPELQEDLDSGEFSNIHCSWKALDSTKADEFANFVTTAIANQAGARIVCSAERKKVRKLAGE